MPKEVHEIVEEWLKANGYDGLYRPNECACKVGDLMPCDEPCSDCEAGFQSEADPSSGYDFMIGPEKK